MQEKMTFLEIWMYRHGLKSAVKPSKNGQSPLEVAAQERDMERLDFFSTCKIGAGTKLLERALIAALMCAPTATVIQKLEGMGAKLTDDKIARVSLNLSRYMRKNCSLEDYRNNAEFLREHENSTLHYSKKICSLYDLTYDKRKWFEIATPQDIGHIFRKNVLLGNIEKAKEILRIGKEKVDVNSMNPNKCDAMNYALLLKPLENAKQMALFLYQNGAKLHTEDGKGLNSFERAPQDIQQLLVEECIKKGDIQGLEAAKKAKINLNDSSYLSLTQDPEVINFLGAKSSSTDGSNAPKKESSSYPAINAATLSGRTSSLPG